MKKLNFNKIKGHFPITLQNAKIINKVHSERIEGIEASSYQSNNVTPQQFYKPISKILQF